MGKRNLVTAWLRQGAQASSLATADAVAGWEVRFAAVSIAPDRQPLRASSRNLRCDRGLFAAGARMRITGAS
jgi:hypothetical protein